jgi:hypothetical protein
LASDRSNKATGSSHTCRYCHKFLGFLCKLLTRLCFIALHVLVLFTALLCGTRDTAAYYAIACNVHVAGSAVTDILTERLQ